MSPNAKEGIKVGLAIVITYGLALRFAWMSPTWAAIAVAFIAQPGEGQSLYKGLMRALGTFVAFFTSLFLLSLFPQNRWMLLIATSPVMGFFAYKMKGQNEYLWFVAGFVTPMIMMAGPAEPGHAFEFAAYRTLETLIGIGVWALVSTFLWPVTNLGTLKSATDKLLATHQKVLESCRQAIAGAPSAESLSGLQSQEAQLVTQGFRRESTSPDFIVTYHAAVEDHMSEKAVDNAYDSAQFERYDQNWTYQYSTAWLQGTLLIDILDAQSKELVWRGSAQAEIDTGEPDDKKDKRVEEAVRKMLKDFPPN